MYNSQGLVGEIDKMWNRHLQPLCATLYGNLNPLRSLSNQPTQKSKPSRPSQGGGTRGGTRGGLSSVTESTELAKGTEFAEAAEYLAQQGYHIFKISSTVRAFRHQSVLQVN